MNDLWESQLAYTAANSWTAYTLRVSRCSVTFSMVTRKMYASLEYAVKRMLNL